MHLPPSVAKSKSTDSGHDAAEKAMIALQEEQQRQEKAAIEQRRLDSEEEQQQKNGESRRG